MLKRFQALALLLAVGFLSIMATRPAMALEAPTKPSDGYVLDQAEALDPSEEQELNAKIAALKASEGTEVGILTVKDLEYQSPNVYSVDVGRKWGIGSKANNNGVLILVSLANPREIYIAVGYGLEGAIPDITASKISHVEIAPSFKTGRYLEGLSKGITAIESASKGEYSPTPNSSSRRDLAWTLAMFAFFLLPTWFISIFGRSKRWWPGAVFLGFVGAGVGSIVHSSFAGAAWSAPLAIIGGMFDAFVSKNYGKWMKATSSSNAKENPDANIPWYLGGGGFGSGGGGGFGSFGGGSFGGGGGGADW